MSLLDGLDPDVRELAEKHLDAAASEGIILRVTQGYRTWQEQYALWLKGRDETGHILHPSEVVTYSPPGHSWHNWRRACDVCIVTFAGDRTPMNVYDGPWGRVGELGKALGLTWGGDFPHPDRPHFEFKAGRTIAAMLAAHPQGLDA
jgi:peptidoglycan LD-endopeptidase CwlK